MVPGLRRDDDVQRTRPGHTTRHSAKPGPTHGAAGSPSLVIPSSLVIPPKAGNHGRGLNDRVQVRRSTQHIRKTGPSAVTSDSRCYPNCINCLDSRRIWISATPANRVARSMRRPWFPAFGGMTTFNEPGRGVQRVIPAKPGPTHGAAGSPRLVIPPKAGNHGRGLNDRVQVRRSTQHIRKTGPSAVTSDSRCYPNCINCLDSRRIWISATPANRVARSMRRPWFPAFGGMTTFNEPGGTYNPPFPRTPRHSRESGSLVAMIRTSCERGRRTRMERFDTPPAITIRPASRSLSYTR